MLGLLLQSKNPTMYLLLLTLALISVLFKSNFFLLLVLLEVSLMLVCVGMLMFTASPWFILPLLGIGACEGAVGLSVSVWLARRHTVSAFAL